MLVRAIIVVISKFNIKTDTPYLEGIEYPLALFVFILADVFYDLVVAEL